MLVQAYCAGRGEGLRVAAVAADLSVNLFIDPAFYLGQLDAGRGRAALPADRFIVREDTRLFPTRPARNAEPPLLDTSTTHTTHLRISDGK